MEYKYSEEEIMAYADGVLGIQLAAEIEESAKHNTELQSRIALYRASASISKRAFSVGASAVSDHLLRSVTAIIAAEQSKSQASNVVTLPVQKPNTAWLWPSAIAASVALVFGYASASLLHSNGSTAQNATGPVLSKELSLALSSSYSGQVMEVAGRKTSFIATFKNGSQQVCREFETTSIESKSEIVVACHNGKSWENLLIVAGTSSSDTYSPAGTTPTVDAFLQAINAGDALSKTEEVETFKLLLQSTPSLPQPQN